MLQPVQGIKGWRTDLKIAQYSRRLKKQIDEIRKDFDAQTDRGLCKTLFEEVEPDCGTE